MIRTIRNIIRKETVLIVSLVLAAATSFFTRPDFSDIDWHVVGSLFNLMAAVLGLERVHLLDTIAVRLVRRFSGERAVTLVMVLLTGLFSMMVTNDVALITLVPLMLLIARKSGFNPMWAVILQTLSANIGSTLTPMGNPQNLFLFSHYGLNPLELFLAGAPFVFSGMAALAVLTLLIIPSGAVAFETVMTREAGKSRTFLYMVLFIAGVAAVFRLLPVWAVALAASVLLFLLDRPLLRKIDFSLLFTFICFFTAVGNLTRIPAVKAFAGSMLRSESGTYLAGLVLSQGISNVPAALMLAPFTTHWRAVLLGVNIGGMGTLIASMASLISYRLYARHYPETHYLRMFHIVNFLMLLVFGVIFLFTFAV